jgi:predicted nucleotidyltransferase
MTIAPGVALPASQIAEICRRYRVRELSLFGSAARGELRPDSDIDLLVDYFPDARPSLLDFAEMMNELSDLLGRRVDLGVKRALKPRIKDRILAEAQVIYAA